MRKQKGPDAGALVVNMARNMLRRSRKDLYILGGRKDDNPHEILTKIQTCRLWGLVEFDVSSGETRTENRGHVSFATFDLSQRGEG